MTTLMSLLIPAGMLALYTVLIIAGAEMHHRLAQRERRPRYPQHVYRVMTPSGPVEVTGYLRLYHQGAGILTFLSPDGLVTHTYSQSGYHSVCKVREV